MGCFCIPFFVLYQNIFSESVFLFLPFASHRRPTDVSLTSLVSPFLPRSSSEASPNRNGLATEQLPVDIGGVREGCRRW